MAPSKLPDQPCSSFLKTFLSLFLLLLLHLGCFIFSTSTATATATDEYPRRNRPDNKKRKLSPILTSSWSFLKGIVFSTAKTCKTSSVQTHPNTPPRSSQHSAETLIPPQKKPIAAIAIAEPRKRSPSMTESEISLAANDVSGHLFFPLRNDIFPCTACGEIFQKPQALESHQSLKHAVTELLDGDSGKNIVRIIFKTGWNNSQAKNNNNLTIHRILKIHNGAKILARFEEYRETVKAKAARLGSSRRDERCVADGNELLRFHCATFLCELGRGGGSSLCGHQYCSVCGIIRSGFSAKLDGISTLSSSWRAHTAIPEEVEEEFGFMNVKRAMLVCRVVAGRVGTEAEEADVGKDDEAFDSVVGRAGSGVHTRVDEEELLVFNPRAVLPCFVIVYTTV